MSLTCFKKAGKRQEEQRRRQERMDDCKFEKGNLGKGRERRRRVGFRGDQSDRKPTEETKKGDGETVGRKCTLN